MPDMSLCHAIAALLARVEDIEEDLSSRKARRQAQGSSASGLKSSPPSNEEEQHKAEARQAAFRWLGRILTRLGSLMDQMAQVMASVDTGGSRSLTLSANGPAALDGFASYIQALHRHLGAADLDSIEGAAGIAHTAERHLSLALLTKMGPFIAITQLNFLAQALLRAESIAEGTLRCFQEAGNFILRSKALARVAKGQTIESQSDSDSDADSDSDVDMDQATTQKALTAARQLLSFFTSSALSRHPDEMFQETLNLRSIRLRIPGYGSSAAELPSAVACLPVSQHFHVIWGRFLAHPIRPCFIQWALEYARVTEPDIFGAEAASPQALLDLTNALYDPTVTPMHIAAALGVAHFCSLLKRHKGWINQESAFGSPLSCALMGPRVFSSESYADDSSRPTTLPHEHRGHKARSATIAELLKARADCTAKFSWGRRGKVSLLLPAFLMFMHTGDAAIYEGTLKGGAALDKSSIAMLQSVSASQLGPEKARSLGRALTAFFDRNCEYRATGAYWHNQDISADAIWKVLSRVAGGFIFDEPSQAYTSKNFELGRALIVAIQESEAVILRRLIRDPRFTDEISFGFMHPLHCAVRADCQEMAEILIKGGAGVNDPDEHANTPLMLAESRDMMGILIHRFGADTTLTNGFGQNVWHLMAASNDIQMLSWLQHRDPHREENILAQDDEGRTPLAASLAYIDDLAGDGAEALPSPRTVRFLLTHCAGMGVAALGTCTTPPVTHHAAAWGQRRLIEALLLLGADFTELDKDGLSALHFVNLFAGPDCVQLLLQLCRNTPITRNISPETIGYERELDRTPAESFFHNSLPFMNNLDSDDVAEHIWETALQSFSQLLTPEVVAYTDRQGRGLWERFCIESRFWSLERYLGLVPRATPRDFRFKALKALIAAGALRLYEEQHKRCGVYASWVHGEPCENDLQLAFGEILRHSRFRGSFVNSSDACDLLGAEITSSGTSDLVDDFLEHRVSLHGTMTNGSTPLRLALELDLGEGQLDRVIRYLINTDVDYNIPMVFAAISDLELRQAIDPLRVLIRNNHGPMPDTFDTQPLISSAVIANIREGKVDVVREFVEKGARLDSCTEDKVYKNITPVLEALQSDRMVHLVPSMLEHASPDFDWLVLAKRRFPSSPFEAPGIRVEVMRSLLDPVIDHLASVDQTLRAKALSTLEFLLEKTPLQGHLSVQTGEQGWTCAHRAAASSSLEALQLLAKYGADFKAVDHYGRTPVHVAGKWKANSEVTMFLLDAGNNTAADIDGKIPWDYIRLSFRDDEFMETCIEKGYAVERPHLEGDSYYSDYYMESL